LAHPEPGLRRESQPLLAGELRVLPRLAAVRGETSVADAAHGRPRAGGGPIDHDHAKSAPVRSDRMAEPDDSGADDGEIEALRHLSARRIIIAAASTATTIPMITSR